MKKLLFAIAIATLAVGGAFAKGPIGTVIVPFEYENPPFYVPCLGEYVKGYGIGEARFHLFETPSGTVHILDNWNTWTVYNTGMTSGTIWVGYGVGPYQSNIRLEKGEVLQWVSKGRFVPIDGHGPEWFGGGSFKLTINANGEVVVLNATPEPGEFKCVGPTK